MHPSVRKELYRLRKSEREAKSKAKNKGKVIKYDYKRRVVTCDGQVIDSYKPTFF